MVFETVFKPSLLRLKPNEDAGWATMAGDHNLLTSGKAQVAGQVILHFR